MAASTLPKPGTKFGPCDEPCDHRDCEETKKTALSRCRLCGNLIGYEVRYYSDPDLLPGVAWVHAACYEDAIEARRRA